MRKAIIIICLIALITGAVWIKEYVMEDNKNIRPTEQTEEENSTAATEREDVKEPAEQDVETKTAENGKPPLKKRVLKEIREWVVSLAIALVVVILLRAFLFTVIRVDGASMNPTLIDKERLFVTVLDVKLNGADRNDVVICKYPGRKTEHIFGITTDTYFVKRVVAVPGDTVSRASNVTYVTYGDTGETVALDEKYANRYAGYDYEYTLGEDEYFVVGDNRANSHDSRDWNDSNPDNDVGPITEDMLVGKVRCVFWPLSAIRGVK